MSAPLTDEGTTRYVETPSWKLKYNEAGAGHPVILLHGSGAGATGWSNFAPNIEVLAQDFRVLALDAPGWGRSDAATSDEYDHPAAVLEFMDALGIEKAALVGNSMGGMTAITFAARYPDRISHLITMGPGSFFSVPAMFGPGDGPSEGLKILQEGYRNPTPEVMKRLVEIMTFSSEHATDELAQQRADNASSRPDHLANFLESFAKRGPVPTAATPQEISSITTKALLIHGRDDRVVHFEHSLRLVSMIADSRLVLLNRCGHWAQLEHAEEFNRLVRSFITDN
jgi:2-hydroxy-6-oxonona-2,4-dienedioate hydrolase